MPFKFFFPVPGRKTSDDPRGSPILMDTPSDSHDNSPFSDPGCKAERVLGTLQPASSQALSNKSTRKALMKKPSYLNGILSEAEDALAVAKDGFPFPDMPGSRGSSRHPSRNLRNQGSSPLLGDRFFKGSPGTDSTMSNPSPRPHFYGSSSTLRSYYDPTKSPLSISQQTSASSARDMALRKGFPSIASPLSQDVSKEIFPSALQNEGRPAPERASSWKPAHPDFSNRLCGTQISSTSIISPDDVKKSPSQLSHSNSHQSASSGRPNWWKRTKAEQPKLGNEQLPSDQRRIDQFDLGMDSLKTNIKKPKAGTKSWFDGVGNDNNSQVINDVHGSTDKTHKQFWNKRLDEFRPEVRSPEHRDAPEPPADRNLGCVSPADAQCTRTKHASEDHMQKAVQDPTSQVKTRNRRSTSAKADLSNQSFLELSSSSDEETDDAEQQETYRGHHIGDSVDQNALSVDGLVSSAERVRFNKPKAVVNTSPRRSKRGSEVIPPVPKIPERPQLQQRVSSMKWRDTQNLKSPIISSRAIEDYTCSSGGASITSQTSSYGHTGTEPQLKKSAPASKVMTVTVEEGELLEAMRQTRASLRQDAFAEGYTKAFHSSRNMYHRPRTSGTDGRVSYLESDRSISPSPSMPTSRQSFRLSDVPSSDKMTRPFSPLSWKPKPPRQAPPIIFPPPRASPTESFSLSDIVPSTPRGRLSPLTPSFITQEDDLHNTFGDISDGSAGGKRGVGGIGKAASGHLRKRTVSSGVVMLDGMEEKARVWENEEEWLHGREDRW
ncbi:MAG: hypothetical protein Q9177_000414 [Variospora cf. flavescens]